MTCPKCGEHLHRSHSRNFRETAIKSVSAYKTYRCSGCGWRGLQASTAQGNSPVTWRNTLAWIVGVVAALLIGLYTVRILGS